MNTTRTKTGTNAVLRPSAGSRRIAEPEDVDSGVLALPDHPLPPTRAARPPRSRGIFLEASTHSRFGPWIVNALCVALAAFSVLAGAEFAEPLLNGKFVSSNAGPGLVASAMRSPILSPNRAH